MMNRIVESEFISFDDFLKVELRIGTIINATINEKARVPAYILEIDFGDVGIKKSSAQITQHYTLDDLIGQQIVAVMNFSPKRVAGVKSEVLVLGAVSEAQGTILLQPTQHAENGCKIA